MSSENRPLLLLVSGPPGSGKSDLSHLLTHELGLFRVSKTDIANGLAATDRADPSNHDRAWRTYWNLLEMLVENGVSVVADQTTWRGQCDVPILTRLSPLATVGNVHCRTSLADERWRTKLRQRDGLTEPEIMRAVSRMESRRDQITEPLDLGCPVLEVETSNGYDPGLTHILQFVADVQRAEIA